MSSAQSPGCRIPCEDGQNHRSDPILVSDCPAERDSKDSSTHNHLRPAHSRTEASASESPSRNLPKKQLSATSEDAISPRVPTIRKLKMDKSEYLSKLRNRICRGNQHLVSIDPSMYCACAGDNSCCYTWFWESWSITGCLRHREPKIEDCYPVVVNAVWRLENSA